MLKERESCLRESLNESSSWWRFSTSFRSRFSVFFRVRERITISLSRHLLGIDQLNIYLAFKSYKRHCNWRIHVIKNTPRSLRSIKITLLYIFDQMMTDYSYLYKSLEDRSPLLQIDGSVFLNPFTTLDVIYWWRLCHPQNRTTIFLMSFLT